MIKVLVALVSTSVVAAHVWVSALAPLRAQQQPQAQQPPAGQPPAGQPPAGRGEGRRGGGGGGLRGPAPIAYDDYAGFTKIFDGASLKNWDGDPTFWRAEGGSIVGESTEA